MAENYTLGPVVDDPFAGATTAAGTAAVPPGGYTLGPVEHDPFREPSTADIIGSGVVSGAGAQTLGTPADVGRQMAGPALSPQGLKALASSAKTIGLISPETEKAVHQTAEHMDQLPLGSQWWNKTLGDIGLPTTENVHPTTPGGRILQHAVTMASAFAAPGIAGKAAGAAKLPELAETLGAAAPGGLPANLALGAAAGTVGQSAAEVVPPEYREAAKGIGTLIGGAGGAAVGAGTAATARGAGDIYRNVVSPLTEAGRTEAATRAATETLNRLATDPETAVSAIEAGLPGAELIPGSRPTTAEISGDPGLLSLQRVRERQSPDLGNAIAERRAGNNDARVDAVQSMAPTTASPEQAQIHLRRHLGDIDNIASQNIEAARQNADTAVGAVAPTMTAEEQANAARRAVEAEQAPITAALTGQEAAAHQNLSEATAQIGGQEALGTAEERAAAPATYGAAMRDPAREAYVGERARLNQLREAIDPSGVMGMRPDAAKAAVQDINSTFTPASGSQFSGAEQHLYDTVSSWGNLIPIDQAFQMRANINGRLAQAMDHSPQEAKRLTMLKTGIDQALEDAVSDTGALEDMGVANRGMPPVADRMAGLETDLGLGPNFTQDVARAYAASPTVLRAAGRDEIGRGVLEAANRADVAPPPRVLSGEDGAGGESPGRFGDSPGDQGIPAADAAVKTVEPLPTGLSPLTEDARQRFAQWNREYAEMMQRFQGETAGKLHAVGKILQRGGAYDAYRLSDAEVPSAILNAGPNEREAVNRFLAAAPQSAHEALDNAYAFSLRRAAQNSETGTLDLGKYRQWLARHEAGLSARPELLDRFNTAAEAQNRLNEIRVALVEHEKSYPLRPGWGEAGILPQFWKPGPQGAETMRRFREITGDRPEAMQAAADYAAFDFANKAIRNGSVIPKAADVWIHQHSAALAEIPGLAEKFANAAEAQRTVERSILAHETARDEFTRSVAGAFMQDDPERAIRRIFSGADRGQKARELMDLVAGNRAAIEGVQRAVIDHIVREFSGAPIAGGEHGMLAPQRLQNFIADNRPVLETLFPNGLARNFDALVEDLRRSQLVPNARMPGGSDTMEMTARSREHEIPHGSGFGTIGATLIGEHVGHVVGGIGGPVGAIAAPVALRWLRGKSEGVQIAANAALDRMLLDPQYALDMRSMYPPRGTAAAPRTEILNRLGSRLVQTAVQSARSDDLSYGRGRYAHGGRISKSDVDTAAAQADRNPTDLQVEAGNYRKGHVNVHGLDITIENPKGSTRKGVDHSGKPWRVKLPAHYGYIKKTEAADGEHCDVYLGPDLRSNKVFVIDQIHLGSKKYDEAKIMIGFPNRGVALANYRAAFSDGRGGERIGGVTEMSITDLKNWLRHGDTTDSIAA